MNDELFEDSVRLEKASADFFTSEKVDFFSIPSNLHPDVRSAVAVYKPSQPGPVVISTHGWHMSIARPEKNSENPYPGCLSVQVDMRGRAFSSGTADCNGYELIDVYDALLYVMEHYKKYISNSRDVHYVGGSGGGGNGYALVGKFPDLFASAVISCGISDYALWYENDSRGEFRDEMDVWIGCTPESNPEAYAARSGMTVLPNVLSPLFLIHGEKDIRVPVEHARRYYRKALELGKQASYLELAGVGDMRHFGNEGPEQTEERKTFTGKGIACRISPQLPECGELVVAGYVYTKFFKVHMNSIDKVGSLRYDLQEKKLISLEGEMNFEWSD